MDQTKQKYAGRRPLRDLNIIDNFLFNELTSQSDQEDSKRFCKILIETLLGWKIGNVSISPQKQFQGFDTDLHGICIDVMIEAVTQKDGEDISDVKVRSDIYDIETNTHKGDDARRDRFYTALIDGRSLQSGTEYRDMKNIYLVLISPYDPFGEDSMIYTVKSRCLEIPDMTYDDGITCVFLYTRGKKNIPGKKVADMLHFIEHSNSANAAVSDDCQTIMDMVDRIKVQREVGVRYMKAIELEWIYREEGREEGRKKGREEGREEGRKEGREEGRKIGRNEGIAGIISMGRMHKLTDDEILSDLQMAMGITLQEAQEYLNNYTHLSEQVD